MQDATTAIILYKSRTRRNILRMLESHGIPLWNHEERMGSYAHICLWKLLMCDRVSFYFSNCLVRTYNSMMKKWFPVSAFRRIICFYFGGHAKSRFIRTTYLCVQRSYESRDRNDQLRRQ